MRSATVTQDTLRNYRREMYKYIVGPLGNLYLSDVTSDDIKLALVPVSKRAKHTFDTVNMLIKSIFYSDKYAGVVVENGSGNPSRLDVYTTDGKLAGTVDFDYDYAGVEIDGDRVILYNEESCRVYSLDGHLKFQGQFDFSVSCVRSGKNHGNSLIVAGSEVMKEIKLK